MAVRQYVGARYVPTFADPIEWQKDTFYEPLTIVNYNNSSYTSKKPVPVGTGNPAEATEYWALTGNYSGQTQEAIKIANEAKETAEGSVKEVKSVQENLTKEISDRKTADNDILNKISALTNDIILFGDSWLTIDGIASKVFGNMYTVHNFGVGGALFSGVTEQVAKASTELDTNIINGCCPVVVVCGVNELWHSSNVDTTTVGNNFTALCTALKTAFKTHPIYYVPSVADTRCYSTYDVMYETFMNTCLEKGIIPIYSGIYLTMSANFSYYSGGSTSADHVHLTDTGFTKFYNYIIGCINGKATAFSSAFNIPFDAIDTATKSQLNVYFNESGYGQIYGYFEFSENAPNNVTISFASRENNGRPINVQAGFRGYGVIGNTPSTNIYCNSSTSIAIYGVTGQTVAFTVPVVNVRNIWSYTK